jgi:ATP-dependent DNA helicase RecG
VIEVGIDVPNATMMVIENAERFGLAQLHQLRGRVGRGAATSFCVLVTEKAGDESWDRLQVLERSQDGFEVAEEDFKQRGPGNIFGTEQSGLPPLMLADLLKDQGLLQEATAMAESVVGADPDLKQNRELAAWVRRWEVGAKSGMGN